MLQFRNECVIAALLEVKSRARRRVQNSKRSRQQQALARELSKTHFERVLTNAAQISMVIVAVVAAVVALQQAQVVLAPVFLAIIVGLMVGPIADALEARGVPEPVSAGIVVLSLLLLILAGGALFYGPLAEWAERLPAIWSRIQTELANWREPMASLGAVQEQIQGALGSDDAVSVTVEDASTVTGIAMLAPAFLAQALVFLVSLYFYVATRENIRISTLSLCMSRRMRWRCAHVFRDVEEKVSRYLITISAINLGVGIVVSLAMWAIGMPSPLLWGALAAVLNYIPFVGQALMALLLFLAALGSQGSIEAAILPVGIYWVVNFIEGNFVSPNLLGRTMTINPFMIFLALAFWIWVWGPVGGLVAVPSLLIAYSIVTHIIPSTQVLPRRVQRRLAAKASHDVAEAEEPEVPPPAPKNAAAA
jgi:predicted PurR-regulated permease PerM